MLSSGRPANAKAGPRIRPPRQVRSGASSQVSEFDQLWSMLREAFHAIHNRNSCALAFEQLYRAAYKIVLKKKGTDLWVKVTQFEQQWFTQKIMPVIANLISTKIVNVALAEMSDIGATEKRELGEKFLKGLRDAWQEHNTAMNMITDILMYMDRAMITEERKPSIFTSTIGLYRDNVLLSPIVNFEDTEKMVYDVINAVILNMIHIERRGEVIDRALVRTICRMLEELHQTDEQKDAERLYVTLFQPYYIQQSRKFYAEECQKLLRNQDCTAWLRHTKNRLAEEEDRCKTTISPRSIQAITKVVEEELVVKHMDDFFALEASGLRHMLDNDKHDYLKTAYHLVMRVDQNLATLKSGVAKRIVDLGLEIEKCVTNVDFSVEKYEGATKQSAAAGQNLAANATLSAIKWVDDVLALKKKFDDIWSQCFDEDLIIHTAITKSFAEFINMFARASEFISLYIDEHLKKGVKGKTEAEIDEILEGAIVLIRYIQDKDMFERYYQKHLARRLLHGKSESKESEELMIARMKQEVGNHFTSKFEGMFKDMSVSEDLRKNYKEHILGLGNDDSASGAQSYNKVDLGITVLTSNNWPTDVMGWSTLGDSDKPDIVYPEVIEQLKESFRKFYTNKRTGRILTWVPSAGVAEIKCTFPKTKESGPLSKERRYDLTVTTYSMTVLMLFNENPDDQWLSFDDIQKETNIPPGELQRALGSISIPPKSRVLVKEPMSKSIKTSDKFSFNKSFHSKTIKIKAPSQQTAKVESKEERKKTENNNNVTRANACSAAIVRIMKQRQDLLHNLLVTEVINQVAVRFRPEVPVIKSQIESLIQKEYLERIDIGEQPGYRYLA